MTVDEAAREYSERLTRGTHADAFAAGAAWAFAECERIVNEHYLHEIGRDIAAAIRRSRSTPAAGEGR